MNPNVSYKVFITFIKELFFEEIDYGNYLKYFFIVYFHVNYFKKILINFILSFYYFILSKLYNLNQKKS
jgi:hypothetical protein